MVPNTDDASDGPLDEEALHETVRVAVREALWDVLGTAVYALFLVLLAGLGLSLVVAATGAVDRVLFIVFAVLGGVLVVAAALGLYRIATEPTTGLSA